MPIHLDCIQGTHGWRMCRMGLPTASTFSRILTPKKLTVSKPGIESLSAELVAQRAMMTPLEVDLGSFAGRGSELEPEAVAWYELQTDVEVSRDGFYLDPERMIGGSPDGVTPEAGIEVKCLAPAHHLRFLMGDAPAEYMAQVQASMLLCERDRWDLLFYHPTLPSRILAVARDDEYLAKLTAALDALRVAVDDMTGRLEGAGVDFAPWREHVAAMTRGEVPGRKAERVDIWGASR